ncbi:hypothetical protein Scep_003167 [Stephania cephalantha]|uniref:Uncharacterized protein n=1 Tax=Stephania cephalantha TaxID=152367 RepID=A0AAP0PU66_9MAGN
MGGEDGGGRWDPPTDIEVEWKEIFGADGMVGPDCESEYSLALSSKRHGRLASQAEQFLAASREGDWYSRMAVALAKGTLAEAVAKAFWIEGSTGLGAADRDSVGDVGGGSGKGVGSGWRCRIRAFGSSCMTSFWIEGSTGLGAADRDSVGSRKLPFVRVTGLGTLMESMEVTVKQLSDFAEVLHVLGFGGFGSSRPRFGRFKEAFVCDGEGTGKRLSNFVGVSGSAGLGAADRDSVASRKLPFVRVTGLGTLMESMEVTGKRLLDFAEVSVSSWHVLGLRFGKCFITIFGSDVVIEIFWEGHGLDLDEGDSRIGDGLVRCGDRREGQASGTVAFADSEDMNCMFEKYTE